MSHPKPQYNDVLAVEGHWLGQHFRVNVQQDALSGVH